MADGTAGLLSCCSLSVVFRFLYLFADGGENLANSGQAKMIGNERWDEATGVSVNRIRCVGAVGGRWLEQPGP